MPCSKRIAAAKELSDSAASFCRPEHAFPAIFPHEISDDNEGASATAKVAAGLNASHNDVGILLDDDTWARR